MVPDDVSFEFIRGITNNFSEDRILGAGAFGVVYKGVTKSGHDVAVKKLNPLADLDNKQFRNELDTLTKLKHQNIVKVLGYCYDIKKKTSIMPNGIKVFIDEIHASLCLEYLHNGSLQKHLYDESCELKLDWRMRFKIIKGICEGLKYMHKDLEEPIYHFDLKPDNILLDKDMVPKIADFGLSKFFGQDIARTTDDAYGTIREISGKFDIFSLGVIIMMIVSGPNGCSKSSNMSSYEYIDEIQKTWRKKLQETSSISDSLLEEYCSQIEICTQIALECLDNQCEKRPDIVKIAEELNGIEVGIGKLPQKGCGIKISEMTVQNNSIEMRMESKDITVQHQNTDLLSTPSCTKLELIDAQETSTDVVHELIVGREEEKEKIITSLFESSSTKISILPIHGIGGIGKTTLSRMIYDDPMFNFYSKAWVHVSQRFDLDKICESIITQLSEKENQANERHVGCSSLKEVLAGKQVIIVLDNIWEDNQFKLMDLQQMLCTNNQPYKILPLTNDMCWDIIKQRSGFEARDDKEKIRCIGHEIAQKCVGVSLAAQSLGFTLRGMNFDQWVNVKDNDIWKHHVSKDISMPNHVLASLKLSYSYMDRCLKPCFTYCAIFPKGYQIVKNDLIYQWISLGFIKPTELLSVMDLCKKYFIQLQGLSFLHELPKTSKVYREEATVFTMHDLVHDLAVSLLGNRLLDRSNQKTTTGISKDYQYALLGECSVPLWLIRPAQLIAMRFHDCCNTELCGGAFAPAKFLKVLDLCDSCIQKLPDSIGGLMDLRYLSATGVRDWMSPECITKLSHLIYLNLHGSAMEKIPESIGELKNLMHLDLSGCTKIKRLPDSFMSLEKLVHLDFSNCSMILGESESLWNLTRLEHLSLSGCSIEGDLAKALCGLSELQYLDLSQVFCSGDLCRGLQQVLVRFTKLRYLDVRGILDKSNVEGAKTETFIKAISSLSSLDYLDIGWNHCLHNIPESIGNLSKLRTLDLSNCVNLKSLPAVISRIDSLKFVLVDGCDRLNKSTLALYKNIATLPYFVVHAGDSESSSNLCELEYENPTRLEISRLENVKSAEEAQRINLVKKHRIEELGLVWTRNAKRFVVDDLDVLEQLVPPSTMGKIRLEGYNSAGFPSWMMDIATYVPHLVDVTLEDMPNCSSLPPLGQLPNLRRLQIRRLDRIRKIDQNLYGSSKRIAFPRLWTLILDKMKCLEEWNKEHTFPNLWELVVKDCPMLKFESSSPLLMPCQYTTIIRSCQVIPSSWKCNSDKSWLYIEGCDAPLHQWSLLRHLPHLTKMNIRNCSDLTCSSTDLLRCLPSLKALDVSSCESTALPERLGDLTSVEELHISRFPLVKALPESLGDLTSLKILTISDCPLVKALPESIQLLTRLKYLEIEGCSQLVQLGCPPCLEILHLQRCESMAQLPESIQQLTHLQLLKISDCPQLIGWCRSDENKMKLAHIKEIYFEGCRVRSRISTPESSIGNQEDWSDDTTGEELSHQELSDDELF